MTDPTKYRLSKWVSSRVRDNDVLLVHDDLVVISGLKGKARELHYLLTLPEFTTADLISLLGENAARTMLRELTSMKAIRETSDATSPAHLSHQVSYFEALTHEPEQYQNAISSSRVAIVGIGGIGGVILQHLLGAGVKDFLLIDGDVVSASNMNRQFLYRPTDVGRKKLDVVDDLLAGYPDVNALLIPEFIESIEQLQRIDWLPDFVVGAADEPVGLIQGWLREYAWENGAGYLSCGVGVHRGSWGPLIMPGVTPCPDCTARWLASISGTVEQSPRQNKRPLTASFGPLNSVVGAAAAADVILTLAGDATQNRADSIRTVSLLYPAIKKIPRPALPYSCNRSGCELSTDKVD
ncbi:ThiF family adenylyltransferase [Streptomyces atratus]|uniref:ThiF family adenylyltransferase n=1 Tax=Streptomyces atratus TaxID=1893 RepID=UPI00379C078D